jgi:hypothetical protein
LFSKQACHSANNCRHKIFFQNTIKSPSFETAYHYSTITTLLLWTNTSNLTTHHLYPPYPAGGLSIISTICPTRTSETQLGRMIPGGRGRTLSGKIWHRVSCIGECRMLCSLLLCLGAIVLLLSEVQIRYLSSFSWFGIFLFISFNYSKGVINKAINKSHRLTVTSSNQFFRFLHHWSRSVLSPLTYFEVRVKGSPTDYHTAPHKYRVV